MAQSSGYLRIVRVRLRFLVVVVRYTMRIQFLNNGSMLICLILTTPGYECATVSDHLVVLNRLILNIKLIIIIINSLIV